jgi:hypothetical protein
VIFPLFVNIATGLAQNTGKKIINLPKKTASSISSKAATPAADLSRLPATR